MQPLAAQDVNCDGLAGVVIVAELVVDLVDQGVDAGDGLELNAPKDGALEGLGERLVYLGGAGKLEEGARTRLVGCLGESGEAGRGQAGGCWGLTSLCSASKKVKPEWPLMVQMNRF